MMPSMFVGSLAKLSSGKFGGGKGHIRDGGRERGAFMGKLNSV